MTRPLRVRLREALTLFLRVLRLLRFSSPWLSVIVAIVTLIEAGLAILGIWLIKELVDVLAAADAAARSGDVFRLLALTALATLAGLAMQAYGGYLRIRQGIVVADYVSREIHDRAIAVDLSFYESPAYFDSLQRARQAGPQRPAQLIATVLSLAKAFIFLAAVLIMLGGIEWRMLPVLLVAVLVALAVRLYFTRELYEWQRRRAQLERRSSYLDYLLTSDAHAKELRLHNLGAFFRDSFTTIRRQIRTEQLRIEHAKALSEIGVSVVGAGAFVGAVAYLVVRALDGTFSLGDLVLFVLLFRRAEQSGRETVTALSRLYDDQLFLGQLFAFFDVRPELTVPAVPKPMPHPVREGLRLENVDFSYPATGQPEAEHGQAEHGQAEHGQDGHGQDGHGDARSPASDGRLVLQGIDLHLPPGKLVAIIGENGSGKTTLIKLLTRLYDPVGGRITLDGVDIRDFDPVEYRKAFSVIFQDFSKYAASAADNIWFGNADEAPDRGRIENAARRAGADGIIDTLARGYDTPLTRIFDEGQELSVGQWQRIALARAFLPPSQFVVMDEPTSAVDPAAEMALFDTLRERLEGRGALIISHRLSTVRHVDYTYVLDKGRILEHGPHDDLIRAGGGYADLFNRQGAYFA